ncbi:MAG: hypothetical protein IKR11_03565 [Solobacterium sp.]|nr:hypothetical protein [Solobacterium sp.]
MNSAYKIIVKETRSFQGECIDDKDFYRIFADIAHQYDNNTVMGEFYEENYVYAVCHIPEKKNFLSCVYYNDFDDYEDEIEIGSESWMRMLR